MREHESTSNLQVAAWVVVVLLSAVGLACGAGGRKGDASGPEAGTPTPGDVTVFPLTIGSTARHLVDQRGMPFLVNGDASWSLTHNLTYEEAVRYMDDRRRKGFNTLFLSVPDAYGPDGSATYPPDRQGNQPFLGDDIIRPNEPYWRHVDRVLARSEELGFLVFLYPAYLGCCNDGFVGLLKANGADRARSYGRFVGQRYASRRNLFWVHGGDLDPGSVRDLVVAVADGIREGGGNQLQAAHWAPETDPYGPLGDDFVDLHTTYTYRPVSALVWKHYSHEPVKPVLLMETHYENDWAGKPAAEVRKYPYRALLSGAAGHVFGNKPLWFCGNGWVSALDSPASRAMALVGALFRSRPWHLLAPDRQGGRLVVAGGGDPAADDGVQAARAADGSFVMAFLPDRRTVRLDLGLFSGTTVRAWWFDIVNGNTVVDGEYPASGPRDFSPPWSDGAVLVLDDAARGFPPPGGTPR
jgi:hypothetical protein